MLVGAMLEGGPPASGKAGKAATMKGAVMAALMDPLSLFAERSPGGRGTGALLSTKPGIGPEERVLSNVRERDPAGGAPADPDFAVTPESLAALPGSIPGGGVPGDPGDPAGTPGGPGGGSGPGGFGGPFFAPAFNPQQPELLPGGAGGPSPPGDPGAPGGPGTPGVPGAPGVSAIPEPATWAMLILGFFAVGAALRRRARNAPHAPTIF